MTALRETSETYYERLERERKERDAAAQAKYGEGRLPEAGMFSATVSLPLWDEVPMVPGTGVDGWTPKESTDDRDRYLLLAAAFNRCKRVVDETTNTVRARIETAGGSKPYNLPWRCWSKQSKATQRGKACQKLSDQEHEWLDVEVAWTVSEGNGVYRSYTGRVWALAPAAGFVWIPYPKTTGETGWAMLHTSTLTKIGS